MGNVLPSADIKKSYHINSKEKIMIALGKTKNAKLNGLTHSTVNRRRRTSVKTFLDFLTNTFHEAMNFKLFNKITL